MNRRLLIGLVLLVVVAGLIVAYQFIPKPDTRPVVTVKGYMGSEKVGFMSDPDVQQILRDKYKLTVNYTPLGSIDQVTVGSTGMDFLWPSNEVALQLYKDNHGGVAKSALIFNSPIVFYSWSDVVDALAKQGTVTQENGIYYVNDMPKLANTLVYSQTKWSDLGVPQLFGNFAIVSSDPTKSNSGNMFALLISTMLNNGQVADLPTMQKQLPDIKHYFDSLGFLEAGSGDIFNRFIRAGEGDKPMIVGYESQLIEFSIANQANRDQILKQVRIIYPRPTEFSSHPIIALTANGDALSQALQDPEIQKIAWEKHGFRSGLVGIQNDPKVLSVVGVPETITSVVPLPQPAAVQELIRFLTAGPVATPLP